jgi:hypothetical protein
MKRQGPRGPGNLARAVQWVLIAAASVAALTACGVDGNGPADDRPGGGNDVSTVSSEVLSSALDGPIWIYTWNGNFVTSEYGGGCDVVANRTVPGPWEEFNVISLGGNWIALQAATTGLYVSAEGGGGGLVHANRTAIGPWEQFWIPNPDSTTWQFNTWNINYWLCAEGGGGGQVNATRTSPHQWETFFIQPLPDLAGYKATRGKCRCKDGYVATSPINPPSKNHDVCTAAVKAACQICWNRGQGPGAGDGCDGR